jgi:hypothetical protein
MSTKYKCEKCGNISYHSFPDESRNITIEVAPYRLPVRCDCSDGNPVIYYNQELE